MTGPSVQRCRPGGTDRIGWLQVCEHDGPRRAWMLRPDDRAAVDDAASPEQGDWSPVPSGRPTPIHPRRVMAAPMTGELSGHRVIRTSAERL
jgi:hypothetical protein